MILITTLERRDIKKDTKCIFEVGGVNQIKIMNAKEAKDNGHIIHPDNIYTIKSDVDDTVDNCVDGGGDVKKLYIISHHTVRVVEILM